MRNKGKYAQSIHITPENHGLLNDPNGLCYYKGYYHVFYQYNPYETDHSVKYWGHVRSKDMQHWEQLPIALKSDDWFDKNGVYSGGAIVHEDTLYLFYTGNTKDENGIRTSYQCLATSTDGIYFEKHGPILEQVEGFTGHVRDPKVWRDDQLNGWWMILGAQRLDKTGDTIVYFSTDLLNWEYKGSILQFDQPLGFMWECPDLIFLTDEVTGEEKAMFIFSPQGLDPVGNAYHNIHNTTYLVGHWDNQSAKFVPDNTAVEALLEVDHGFEFYAPQTFLDSEGRNIQYAWMGMMWPEVEQVVPTRKDGWLHHLSLPKSLHLVDGRLVQKPVAECIALMHAEQVFECLSTIDLTGPTRIQIGDMNNEHASWELYLDNELKIIYQANDLIIERTNWLTSKREQRKWEIAEGVDSLDLWIDTSSIEVFVNNGDYVFSQRVFAEKPLMKFEIVSGADMISKLRYSSLKSYQFMKL